MSASLRVLYVAYPLLPVTEASCGGAEQVLLTLEKEMARRGHATVVAAAAGSRVAGELYRTGAAASGPDQFAQRDAEHNRKILQLLDADNDFDLVHDMSGTFWRCATEVDVPVLATVHLPPVLYSTSIFDGVAPNLSFNFVSQWQARMFAQLPRRLGVVQNGIELERFPFSASTSRDYLLWLGRICEEKAPHLALEVSKACGAPLVIAGSVYPFSYHQQYFAREVLPRLDSNSQARFIDSPEFPVKLDLLRNARALLITSMIDETSSLVAMEAAACGTPVVAFRRGALPEIVADGRTGFLVHSVDEMLQALDRLDDIERRSCREHVERNFSATRMADDYDRMYRRLSQHATQSHAGLRAA